MSALLHESGYLMMCRRRGSVCVIGRERGRGREGEVGRVESVERQWWSARERGGGCGDVLVVVVGMMVSVGVLVVVVGFVFLKFK